MAKLKRAQLLFKAICGVDALCMSGLGRFLSFSLLLTFLPASLTFANDNPVDASLVAEGVALHGKENLERAVASQPTHRSANLRLAQHYAAAGMRVPALLAYLHLLSLEPGSQPAKHAAGAVRALLEQGVDQTQEGPTAIFTHTGMDRDQLSIRDIDLLISLHAASRIRDRSKGKSELEMIAETLNEVLYLAQKNQLSLHQNCFACKQYAPFLVDLRNRGLLLPFIYVAMSSQQLPGGVQWLADNAASVEELKTWLVSSASR